MILRTLDDPVSHPFPVPLSEAVSTDGTALLTALRQIQYAADAPLPEDLFNALISSIVTTQLPDIRMRENDCVVNRFFMLDSLRAGGWSPARIGHATAALSYSFRAWAYHRIHTDGDIDQ